MDKLFTKAGETIDHAVARMMAEARHRLRKTHPYGIRGRMPSGERVIVMPSMGGGARDDVGLVRHSSWPAVGESSSERAVLNRLGSLVVTDLVDQLVLGGWAYHVQLGTEDAPINSTTSIDDQLVWAVADNNAGYACIPLLCELNIDFVDTAVNSDAMLEVDKDLKRYSSGGTAFVPANMRGDDARSFNGVAYVGTDVTVIAKSAVPNSVELARKSLGEDAVTDPTTGKLQYDPILYSAKQRPIFVMIDASSLLFHFGAGTADLNGYGVLQFAQVDKAMVI